MQHHTFDMRCQALKRFYYLPIFYMIPNEIAIKRKLSDFPRNPFIAATSEHWQQVYFSKWFQVTLAEIWGWMMWQCLGIRGGIDNYSKNDPFVRMVLNLPMWAWLLAEQGIDTNFLAIHKTEIPFPSMEIAAHNCEQITKRFWEHPMLKMRKVFEIVNAQRCHSDFSSMPSHVKIDFHRQYYHTRAKIKVEPIISGYSDEGEEEIVNMPYVPNEFAEVEFRLWFEEFLICLNEKDRRIIKLLEYGYTQEETGKILGYSNHSGVNKRIKYIRNEFNKFKKEQ